MHFHDGATNEDRDGWVEPVDTANEAWYWTGVTIFIVGPGQSTIPDVDSAFEDF